VTTDFSQAAATQLRPLEPVKAAEKIAADVNLGSILVEDNDNVTAENLNNNPILKELGIQFTSDDAMFNQEIIFTKPFVTGEESPTITIPVNDETQIQRAIQTIKSIISTYGPLLNEEAMRKYGIESGTSSAPTSTSTRAPR
jgi:hypothetical protein